MDPVTAGLVIAGTGAAIKGVSGAIQNHKGKKLAKSLERPTKELPPAVRDYLKNAKARASNSRLPGQTQAEEGIQKSSAGAVRGVLDGAQSQAGLLASISAINANENDAMNNLAVKGAEFQEANKDKLQDALKVTGEYESHLFDVNKMQPYLDKADAAKALQAAGRQNMMSAVDDVTAMGTAVAMNGTGSETSTIGQKTTTTGNKSGKLTGIDPNTGQPIEISTNPNDIVKQARLKKQLKLRY